MGSQDPSVGGWQRRAAYGRVTLLTLLTLLLS